MPSGTLWLVGMMGSGKSVVGDLVASRVGAEFVDLDEEVSARAGASIPELWRREGEGAFRELEAAAVERLSGESGGPRVVATGGGVVLRADNVEAMRSSGTVVWLDAPAEVLLQRVAGGEGRPLLAGGPERLSALLAARRALYETAGHHRVQTAGRSPEEVAQEVAELWSAS